MEMERRAVILPDLPVELLGEILSNLTPKELKELRLTCRRLACVAEGSLYRNIRFSLLQRDYNNFVEICSRQDVLNQIEEVTWYECGGWSENEKWSTDRTGPLELEELAGEVSNFENGVRNLLKIHYESIPITYNLDPEATRNLMKGIRRTYEEAFWYRKKLDDLSTPREFLKPLLRRLRQGFLKMPRLRTLTSVPMANDWIIGTSGYPLSADIFGHQSSSPGFGMGAHIMLAMDLNVKRLQWIGLGIGSSLRKMKPTMTPTFERLKDIEITITNACGVNPGDCNGLLECLQAASNLRRLRFGVELPKPEDRFLIFERVLRIPYWPHLAALALTELSCAPQTLATCLLRHNNTLRHLEIAHFSFYHYPLAEFMGIVIARMSTAEQWYLQSFNVVCDGIDHFIDEQWLIETIKNPPDEELYDLLVTDELEEMVAEASDMRQWSEYGLVHGHGMDDDNDDDDSSSRCGGRKTWWSLTSWRGKILFQALDEPAMGTHQTEVWKLIHRDGTVIYSDEGYGEEYFSDWDSEAGDEVEATPYGAEFDVFANDSRRPLSLIPTPLGDAHMWLGGFDSMPVSLLSPSIYSTAYSTAPGSFISETENEEAGSQESDGEVPIGGDGRTEMVELFNDLGLPLDETAI